ncbi:thioredoxin-dependent thiol peroxidase [candidate division KSB1 bacterium]
MSKLASGDKAPAFDLADQDGNSVKLSDFSGEKVLLYFYPRADTPGCTRQACSVRDSHAELEQTGIRTVGISPDDPEKQKKFDSKYDLGFPLLSDPDHAVAEAFGAWGEKNMYGQKKMGIIRSSFLIDESGTVVDTWYKVKPEDTVPKAIETAGE